MDDPVFIDEFSTPLEIMVFIRAEGAADWQVFDRGPGIFHIPAGNETAVRIQNIGDEELEQLIEDLRGCRSLRELNLSENRKVTNRGLAKLTALTSLTAINLSSCDISNEGLAALAGFPQLEKLNLSYCNRLTDEAFRHLRQLNRLTYLDLQGTPKIKQAGVTKLARRGLTIHK